MNSIIKILHLEDDPNDAELVRSHLEAEGFICEITRVDTRDQYTYLLKHNEFDLILADFSLPAFDGLSALTLAKKICPNIPFILLSGMLGEELAIDSMKAGATDYVLKQRLSRLLPSIKRALREAEDREQRLIAEEALRESEKKYITLVDNIDIGVALINPDMELVALNPQIKKWFPSIDKADRTKKPTCFYTLNIPPKDEECPDCPVVKTYSDGQRHELIRETQIANAVKYFRVISTPIKDSAGNVINVIKMMEDVTEKLKSERDRKRLEEQLQQAQKMEAIGTLAGGIAHDLNNILSPIMAYTEMTLMDLPAESPLYLNLKKVYKASERARDLIKQILSFSRQKQREKKPIIVSIIINEVLKLLRPSIPSNIEINQNIEAKSDMILADPTQIHQIILNLCTNASYAMKEKGGKLTISLKSEYLDSRAVKNFSNLTSGYYVKLTVSDTGTGMNDDIKKRIFEPYFTTKNPGEGTGMGLAVIHGIITNLNGDITVESRPGNGSTFNVYFPKISADLSSKAEQLEELMKGNEHILFVDDEKIIVEVVQTFLENLGYKVTAEINSTHCLETFTGNPDNFELVITDMAMPDLTGKDLAVKILAIRPDIPIILCTGYSDIIDESKAREIGIKAFIMKPFIMHEMANTIYNILHNK